MESSTSSSSLHVASWLWSHSFVVSSVQLYCHKIHHSFIVFKCSTHEPNTATGTQLFFCPDSLFAFHSFSFLRLLLLEILFWRQRRPFLAILFIRQLESNAVLTHAEHRTLNWTAEMPFLMSLGLSVFFSFSFFSFFRMPFHRHRCVAPWFGGGGGSWISPHLSIQWKGSFSLVVVAARINFFVFSLNL